MLSSPLRLAFRTNRLWPEHDEEGDRPGKELNDTHALAVALFHAAFLSHFERHSAEVEHLAADLLELATRQNFALWLTAGEVLLGWARGVSGSTAEGLSRIENGIRGYRAAGSMLNTSWALALKVECGGQNDGR